MASVIGSVDLSKYVLAGRYNLPEPTRTTPPPHSLLAQEASAITYNSDTDTLFVVGDGGTSIVQISKTGELIDSMTLAQGNSPQGTEFYDPEGLAYIGAGVFVMVEERDRQAVRFSYAAGTTLSRADTKTVKLGTTMGNVGLEGLSYDPSTSGYIFVKEIDPEAVFQTSIDFDAGTASNGSATTANSVNLFNPVLAGFLDFADVFALSNLAFLSGSPLYNNLLILSQEESKIVNISRSGVISNWLQLQSAPTVSIPLPEQQTEGLTMDSQGNLYVVSENGGGDFDHPQLWVYTQSSATNQAPSALALTNQVTQILENSNTSSRQRVADIKITDDELGNNSLGLQGADSSFFEIFANALYLKAGVSLDYETKTTYSVTVTVDDPTVGSTPDLTANFSLAVLDVANETPPLPALFVSEAAPWSSGNSPFNSDWFELTNASPTPVTITGWKMDDNSNSFGLGAPLSGITTLAAGESVVFMEIGASDNAANKKAAFLSTWFGANPPASLQVGTYTGGGLGLSTGGDAVNIYNSTGVLQANITFGASPAGPFPTFNNAAGLTNASVTTMSAVGVNGAFQAPGDSNNVEIGSPGSIGKLFISEVAPWSSGNSPVAADWFELTNTTSRSIDLSGWKMDDSSGSYAAAVALSGISAIAPGESVIFIETPNLASAKAAFLSTWFGASAPANLQIGSYSGSGVGLSTGGDAVNLYDASGVVRASVSFGGATTSAPFLSFNNVAGASSVSLLSSAGLAGAFVARNDSNEVGSPGGIGNLPTTFNFSASSYSSTEGTVNNGLTPATVRVLRQGDLSGTASVQLAVSGGTAQGAAAAPAEGTSTGPSSSATPYVLPISGSGVSTKSLLTVGDAVNGYAMVGIPDGLGAFDNGDGTFTLLMNQELGSGSGAVRAHGAKGAFVSSWVINKADLSVVSGADLIQNVYGWNSTSQSSNSSPNNGANGNAIAINRFCSADLPAASAFYNASSGLGSQARIFMNGEEGGSNGYPIATIATGTGKGNAYVLGKFNLSTNGSGLTGVGGWENLLANPYAQDKTIVIGNNDGGSGLMSGALAVYVGTKTNAGTDVDKAGLTNGSLKFVTVAGNAVEITNTTTRTTGISSGTRFTLSGTASTTFSRPEDGAWDPKDPSKYYFVTTDRLDQVTDGIGSQIGNSRLWRLSFDDITNPEAGGSVDLLIDGDIVGGQKVNMFDNMSINQFGQVLLQEDVGGAQHNGKIWQYDIATDSLKVIAQHDVARFGTIGVAATSPFTNDEESSGIIDMQDILGAGWSLFVDQAHYPNANPDLVEGGQLLALFNPDTYKAYGPDLIGTTQTINFAAGEAFKNVNLQVFGDTLLEGVETANLILQNPSAGSMVGTTQPAAQLLIQDVNPTPTALNLTQTSINENVSANSVVGLLTATLPISGDTCVFTFASGSGDQDNSSFQIVGNQLKLLVSPNFEAKASYSIRIKATEQGGNALDSVFSIAINDLNEIASISGTATASVKEGTNASNAGLLTASGTLTVNDPDAAQSKFDTNVVAANGNLGTLIITESGAYSYSVANALPAIQALAAGQSRQDTFTVKSLDGTASQDIVVTIQGASAGFNGVAAGDATTNRATLWTRSFDTADSTKRTGLSESVTLQLATDSSFSAPVFTTTGSTSNASHDYTLKLDATGLSADTTYYYRFQAQAGELSQVGTFKTAPLATNNRTVRFGHSGDVDGVMRPYLAMQDLGPQKLDFFLFDGDTIYETVSSGSPAAPTTPATEANPTPANVQALRDGYYRKYLENLLPAPNGTYPGLRDFFAAQGNYTTLDNHELGNKEIINGGAPLSLRALNFNGSTDTADDVNTTGQYINDSVSFETLLGAYLDYQPIRTPETLSTPSDGRSNGELKLYGSQQWGGNVLMISLDDRSFRDVRLNKIVNGARVDDTGSRADNPGRTMLGATQLAWLKQELLAAKANSTAWTFINMSSPIDQIGPVGSGLDGGKSWIGGYRAERNDLLKFIADNKITNVAFLACDDHQGRINELTYMPNPASDPFSPASYKTLPGVLSIVDGPMGATGPDTVTNHSPSNIKALADALAQAQINAGLNPIGLDKNFPGLFDVKREGDPSAPNDPKPVDFFTPDTFNYAVLEVTKEGILNVALRGVDSYASNSFPAPAPGNQPREILSFSIDGLQAQRPYRFTPQSQAVYEGDQLTIKVTAENAARAAGKPFFWKFSGPGVTPADFKENSLTGKGSTGNDGTYSLTRTLAADLPIEGEEALKVTFYQDGAFTKPLAPAISIRVLEPNTTGPSDTRDLLTGTPLDDTLSGFPNGSTLRGLGTVDTLIGNAGNDLFRLGDAAGRFYDDLNNTTPGTADFAYIKDFNAGDRIQLTGKPIDYILGTALFDGVVGNVIYARNPNRLPFERPVGNDEWIGFVKSTDNSHLSLSNANQFSYVG
jgi:VCBS repeat-containing protein